MPTVVPARGLCLALSLASAFSVPLAVQAQYAEASPRIGWNFTYDGTNGALDPADVAGLNDPMWGDFRQDNWNNDPTLGQSGSPNDPDIADLLDAAGLPTGASLDWTYSGIINSWSMQAPATTDPNEYLMYGYQARDPRLQVENIPYACYALVLYYNQDGLQGNSTVTLSEIGGSVLATRSVSTGDPDNNVNFFTDYQNGGFRVEDGVGAPTPSNATVFYDLRTPNLQIDFTWPDDGSIDNVGTSGLQIVDTTSACIFADGFENGTTSLWM